MKKFTTTIKTERITSGYSCYGRTNSYSFSYRDTINKSDIGLILFKDKSFHNLQSFLKEKDKICFIYTKGFGGDILRVFQSRDGDIRIETDNGFIIYNGKVYIGKINKLTESNNGNGYFGSANEWLKDYEIILDKEILLPKITIHIKDKYKTKEGEYIFDNELKEFIKN